MAYKELFRCLDTELNFNMDQWEFIDGNLQSPKTCINEAVTWIHPPTPHVQKMVQAHVRTIPRKAACLLIPKDGSCKNVFESMNLLKTYKKGDVLPSPSYGFRTCLEMDLWLDKGKPMMECRRLHDESEALMMTFPGQIKAHGKLMDADILIDTGATHCFIDASFARSQNLPETLNICPQSWPVKVPGHQLKRTIATWVSSIRSLVR